MNKVTQQDFYNSLVRKLATINKDVRRMIDLIIWKNKIKNVNNQYTYVSCVFVPTISNKTFLGCRSVGINRRQVNYRVLKQNMRICDQVIRSFLIKNQRKINDFTPDKYVATLPKNYAYTRNTKVNSKKR